MLDYLTQQILEAELSKWQFSEKCLMARSVHIPAQFRLEPKMPAQRKCRCICFRQQKRDFG